MTERCVSERFRENPIVVKKKSGIFHGRVDLKKNQGNQVKPRNRKKEVKTAAHAAPGLQCGALFESVAEAGYKVVQWNGKP